MRGEYYLVTRLTAPGASGSLGLGERTRLSSARLIQPPPVASFTLTRSCSNSPRLTNKRSSLSHLDQSEMNIDQCEAGIPVLTIQRPVLLVLTNKRGVLLT